MKAECERCKQIVELSFAPTAGGIDVACSSCGARYFVAAEAEKLSAAPRGPAAKPTAGEQECPKCSLVQPRAEACRRCGLVFVRWKGAEAEPAAVAAVPSDGSAAALWAAVEGGWNDDVRHDAFLAFCQRTDQFSYAAGRYRAAQTSRGAAAEPAAARALARIEKLAITVLELSSRKGAGVAGQPLPYRRTMTLLAVALFLLTGGLLWVVFRQSRPSPDGGDVEERVIPVAPAARRR